MAAHNISFYGEFVNVTVGKTTKFQCVKSAGYYPPMDELRGRDGRISLYFVEALQGVENPAYRLQAKNSLNFTGLKEYFVGGQVSGYAYGYPLTAETYGKNKRKNPFFLNRRDGFLFRFFFREDGEIERFYMIVLDGAKSIIASYMKMLADGGFDEELADLKRLAV